MAASSVTIRYNRRVDWTNAPQTHEAIPVSNSATPPPPTLSVLYAPDGDRSGQRVVVDHTLEVGRVVSDFGGMPFEDGQMSRLHATIRLVGDQVTVEDGGSTNGTMVNGLRVQRQHLQEGDILQIGSTFFGYDRLSLSPPEELEEEAPRLVGAEVCLETALLVEKADHPESPAWSEL